MRPLLNIIAACALALSLSACAGSGVFGSNPQGDAGLSKWSVGFNEDGTLAAVEVVDGKEKQDVHLAADIKAGTVSYSATAVKAFAAFESRADVEKWVASRWPELAPDVRASIADVIGLFAGVPPP